MSEEARVLPWRHFLLALLVMAIWGSNFVIMKAGLAHLPPFLFAALRFLLVAFPLVFVLARPAPWRDLAAYGLLIGVGQFGVLFFALDGRIAPGIASLVIQTQVFFTIGAAMLLNGARPELYQHVALALAIVGLAMIGAHTDGHTSPAGLALTLAAALAWAFGNLVQRRSGRVDALAYVVWSSLFAGPSLLALSAAVEGPDAIARGLREADLWTWGAVLWQSVGNSMLGYGAWGWLLARYPVAVVSPTALLVPVFGLGTAMIALGEPLPPWKAAAAGLVFLGLALNLLWPRLRR